MHNFFDGGGDIFAYAKREDRMRGVCVCFADLKINDLVFRSMFFCSFEFISHHEKVKNKSASIASLLHRIVQRSEDSIYRSVSIQSLL